MREWWQQKLKLAWPFSVCEGQAYKIGIEVFLLADSSNGFINTSFIYVGKQGKPVGMDISETRLTWELDTTSTRTTFIQVPDSSQTWHHYMLEPVGHLETSRNAASKPGRMFRTGIREVCEVDGHMGDASSKLEFLPGLLRVYTKDSQNLRWELEQKMENVPLPALVVAFNRYMGGVDNLTPAPGVLHQTRGQKLRGPAKLCRTAILHISTGSLHDY